MRKAKIGEILPFVRYVHTIQTDPHFYRGTVRPYDHRLFFVRRGSFRLSLEEDGEITPRTVFASDLVFLPAGKAYGLSEGDEELDLVAVNFDFFLDHAHAVLPIPPDRTEQFCPENRMEEVAFSDAPVLGDVLILPRQGELLELFRRLEEESLHQGTYFREYQSAYLKQILLHAARAAQCGNDAGGRRAVERVIALIREEYDRPIDNAEIAARLNYHPNYLNRLMLKYTDSTLHQYLLNHRFDRAVSLLMTTDLTLSEVASRSGFGDVSHFSKAFRKRMGQSPGKFRVTHTDFNE